jgi:type IV secretory pathway VirB9-like protein
VETTKRTISIELTSRRADYMPLVAIDTNDEADETKGAWAAYAEATNPAAPPKVESSCDDPPSIPPDQYEIKGDDVSWRPVQAYAVSTPSGIKTCVEFPSSIASTGLPALLALADDGGWFSAPTKILVNVHYLHRRFEIDQLLNKMILVNGVGSEQQAVKITRKKGS